MAEEEKKPDSGTKQKTEKKAASALQRCSQPSPQEIILSATTLTLLLAEGKSRYELETLINLLSLTTRNLQSVLTQTLINEKTTGVLEVLI